jgi:hypothetical protein
MSRATHTARLREPEALLTHRRSRTRGPRGARAHDVPFDSCSLFPDPRAAMLASTAHEALALALASLEDRALDEVRLDRAQLVGKEVHAVFACPSACHAAASRALTRAAGHLANELAVELDRKRALRLSWSLVTDEELSTAHGASAHDALDPRHDADGATEEDA